MIKRLLILFLILGLPFGARQAAGQPDAGSWSGLIYSKYYLDLADNADAYNAFEFERLYVNYRRPLSDKWGMRLTTDIGRLNHVTNVDTGSKDDRLSVYMKYIYLERKGLIPDGSLILGLSGTPTFGMLDVAWGYRGIQKTIFDYNGWGSSADIGAAANGRFSGGSGYYHVMLGNGAGYNHMELDKHKKLMAYLQYSPNKVITVAGYGDIDRIEPLDTYGNFTMVYLHLGLNSGPLSAGGEIIRRSHGKAGALSALTVYGNIGVAPSVRLLGRVDIIRPEDSLRQAAKYAAVPYRMFIAGIDFNLGGGIQFVPNIQIETGDRERKHLNLHMIVTF